MSAKLMPAKKRGSNKQKMAEYQKRARRGMLGFSVSWIDADPFSEVAEIAGGEISHSNPTQKLICVDMWRKCSQWIVTTEFVWTVRMSVIFETERRGDGIVECEFSYTGTLRGDKSEQLNAIMQREFDAAITANNSYPAGHKNKGVYLQTEFVAKITGV